VMVMHRGHACKLREKILHPYSKVQLKLETADLPATVYHSLIILLQKSANAKKGICNFTLLEHSAIDVISIISITVDRSAPFTFPSKHLNLCLVCLSLYGFSVIPGAVHMSWFFCFPALHCDVMS
jgi:hypothetical protein